MSRCTAGINDIGGKFATEINNSGGKFPPVSLVSLIPVSNNGNNYQTADNLK
jgi:hypothetical protein